MKLYQNSSSGKIKFIEITTDGKKLVREWGLLGGKTQRTVKVCKPMNVGKKNELTAEEQAKAEMKAKIALKMKEGYAKEKPANNAGATIGKIDLDNIPSEFCPCKPISECPETVLKSTSTLGQRKHNGHCVFLVKGRKQSYVFSRRMENLTASCISLPFVKAQLDKLSAGDFVLTEITFHHNALNKEIPRFVAQVIRNSEASAATSRYTELSKTGVFACRPFDILFNKYDFIGNKDYETERYPILKAMKLYDVIELFPWEGPNSKIVEKARSNNWEGFVLRTKGSKSHISYSMDGKAHRAGSYKFKFTKTDDYVVDEALYGKSGKHSQFVSKFHIIEYDAQGGIIDRGYVGPGTLSHEQLEELTKELKSGKRSIPFVVEVEYAEIHDETGKLQFGIIQRIRDDKAPSECVSEE
jgi:predicted DNA-binding WGR domain protein